MAQQFDSPKTETQLRGIQDKLYQHSKEVYDAGGRPAFKGLLEIMSAEATIITAIHNIKSNHGSETPGVDLKTMRKDYLEKPYQWVIKDIQGALKHFEAQEIRRKYIDKPGKAEKRPLGIPTIRDRIVQECMKLVLEPILEAQFFAHSYGFRPMRDAEMALARINQVSHVSAKYWIVEGDISKCFDNIDHSILLRRLYHIGIKDRRVLQIVKAMLRAGIMDECAVNEYGTPQGGIISPLLANAYLDIMDEWVAKQWERKNTRRTYRTEGTKRKSLYDKAGNVVDTIVSDYNGRAVSKLLPLGRYTIREVQAPDYYSINPTVLTAYLDYEGQIVTFEVEDNSVSTGVSIKKTGYAEVMPNQPIRYTITGIGNTSTVPLSSFYWRDTLPGQVQLSKVVTGTYNQQLSYKIVYKTNLKDSYQTLADSLSTTKNYVLEASPAALGLASNERVTEIMFVFGTVKGGFGQVETAYIHGNVVNGLANGSSIVNVADVGGVYNGQWIQAVSRWVTKVYAKTITTLPKTGY